MPNLMERHGIKLLLQCLPTGSLLCRPAIGEYLHDISGGGLVIIDDALCVFGGNFQLNRRVLVDFSEFRD
jgi:hypothetical protein